MDYAWYIKLFHRFQSTLYSIKSKLLSRAGSLPSRERGLKCQRCARLDLEPGRSPRGSVD